MRTRILAPIVVIAAGLFMPWARGSLISTNNTLIPDGNLNGVQFTLTVTDEDLGLAPVPTVMDLNITLDLIGGYNGDLFAYLAHDGALAIVLNRVGTTSSNAYGYSESGFNMATFDDEAVNDIHNYLGVTNGIPSGVWQPDARSASPFVVVDTSTRDAWLTVFDGKDARGDWTLFVADLSGGDQSTLVSWGLTIEVPEPGSLGLVGLAALLAWRRRRAAV
jgi:hypothetical protein